MSDAELVQVFDAQSEMEASLYKEMLEEAGIPVIVQQVGGSMVGYPTPFTYSYLLFVRNTDSEQAAKLAADFHTEVECGVLEIEEEG